MNICPFCDRNNRDGSLICDHCGRSLSGFQSLQTRVVEKSSKPLDSHWQGHSPFNSDTQIILFVDGFSDSLVLPIKARIVLGRTKLNHRPDIDLTPYAALEEGVSSQHAALERTDTQLVIIDLASTNGTFLNRQKLQAYQPAIIRDGAEVYLGRLALRLYFETTAVGPLSSHVLKG